MISRSDRQLSQALFVSDRNISNKAVADKISAQIKGIYSWIVVESLAYRFPGSSETKDARVITVRPSNWESFCRLITFLWQQVAPINQNRAISAILGSKDQQDLAHLEVAAQKNLMFKIYLSFDGDNIDVTSEKSGVNLCATM